MFFIGIDVSKAKLDCSLLMDVTSHVGYAVRTLFFYAAMINNAYYGNICCIWYAQRTLHFLDALSMKSIIIVSDCSCSQTGSTEVERL